MPTHIGMQIERAKIHGHGEEYLSAGSALATGAQSAAFCFPLGVGQTSRYRCFSADMAILAKTNPHQRLRFRSADVPIVTIFPG